MQKKTILSAFFLAVLTGMPVFLFQKGEFNILLSLSEINAKKTNGISCSPKPKTEILVRAQTFVFVPAQPLAYTRATTKFFKTVTSSLLWSSSSLWSWSSSCSSSSRAWMLIMFIRSKGGKRDRGREPLAAADCSVSTKWTLTASLLFTHRHFLQLYHHRHLFMLYLVEKDDSLIDNIFCCIFWKLCY